ncbi:N/A [soil metagenome]
MSVVAPCAPTVTRTDVTFLLADADDALAQVKLHQEVQRPRAGPAFSPPNSSDTWRLRFPRPPVDRMEYKLELVHRDGRTEVICDPGNPSRAPGPFGDKSVIEWPGYRPPRWLGRDEGGSVLAADISSKILKTALPMRVWTSPGVTEYDEAPLLVVHDGFDYAGHANLLELLSGCVAEGTLPPMRAALLAPVERDHSYSASAPYARALAHEILPALRGMAPTPHGRRMRVGMGASLGALAMLHAHRSHPATFGSLFLQSGSFFRQRFDRQESSFVRFRRISRHVGRVLGAQEWAHPIPVSMTCGTVEENLANNRATRAALVAQGYDVSFRENRDAHNWVGWRDAFEPSLVDLLKSQWT